VNLSQGHLEEGFSVGSAVVGLLVGIWEILGIPLVAPNGAKLGASLKMLGTKEREGSGDGTLLIVGALVGTLVGFTVAGFLLILGLFVGLAVGVFFKAAGIDGLLVGLPVGTLVFLMGAVVGAKVG